MPKEAHIIRHYEPFMDLLGKEAAGTTTTATTTFSHEAYCKLLVPLYRRELQYAVTKYMSCFFRPVYAGVEVVGMVEASAELTYKLNQLLQSTGCGQSLQDFASKLDCRDVARFGESVPFGLVIAQKLSFAGRIYTPHALDRSMVWTGCRTIAVLLQRQQG